MQNRATQIASKAPPAMAGLSVHSPTLAVPITHQNRDRKGAALMNETHAPHASSIYPSTRVLEQRGTMQFFRANASAVTFLTFLTLAPGISAQTRIPRDIDRTQRGELTGHLHPKARAEF